jgi:hypothetical protein
MRERNGDHLRDANVSASGGQNAVRDNHGNHSAMRLSNAFLLSTFK